MRQLLLATRNAHKTREFAQILGAEFEVRDLASAPESGPVKETGLSFAENAILKAVAISKQFVAPVVADDSGLEVDALGGAPGIYSARYAGADARDAKNVAKLLAELARCDANSRGARFRCVLALAREGKVLGTFEGAVEGTIVRAPHGTGGFGYDSVFQPAGLTQTFAELSSQEKNRISHRARAIQLLRSALLA
ncbi:MAG: XTP/dITP diphosphohydrolase [Verrucomicrobiota bacterium]|jgi:XTP/dITP diphosphohydrolase